MLHSERVLPRNSKHHCYTGGIVNWRTAAIHYTAKALGLCVKLEGFPLGSSRNLTRDKMPGGITCGTGQGGLSK